MYPNIDESKLATCELRCSNINEKKSRHETVKRRAKKDST